jgi:ABC-type phosphate transport system auxiliary subunit
MKKLIRRFLLWVLETDRITLLHEKYRLDELSEKVDSLEDQDFESFESNLEDHENRIDELEGANADYFTSDLEDKLSDLQKRLLDLEHKTGVFKIGGVK